MMEEINQFLRTLVPNSIHFALTLLFAIIILLVGNKLIKKIVSLLKKSLTKKEMEQGALTFLVSVTKVALYAILLVVVAQILGFATSSIIALVGSAGLAVGLALQGSLANFAGGILILIMKPFVVGDYIIVGDIEGTVQKIDVVYTTLHTLDNRAAVLPNGNLADSNIINVTREDKRRIDISIGIEYSENIGRVREVLQKIIDSQEQRMMDMPVDIVVASLDDSAVTMAIHMWVRPEDYWPTRWGMLEQIKNEFDQNHIVIPFNQLDVNLNGQ